MILAEIKNIRSDRPSLRKFGLVVGIAFALLAVFLYWRHKDAYTWFLIFATIFVVPALLAPAILKPLHKVWMTAAIILGWVMTRVILTVFFFLVVTPIGVLGRLSGKSFLDTRFDASADSYWVKKPGAGSDRSHYERQF